MATLTLVVIIAAAILFGAELGPKADPTTTTYTPRPEWYFFFLFELLRVVKPPALVFMATVGIPTICLVLLIILPFIDRNPERNPLKRPIATLTGITVIAAMAYLTIEGAIAGSPTEIEMKVAKQYEPGRAVAASSSGGTLPEEQVRAMFDRIARVYDLMNSVMTVGLHHRWRERAADLAEVGAGDRALDVASGTGDLAIVLSRRVAPGGEVVGSDFS